MARRRDLDVDHLCSMGRNRPFGQSREARHPQPQRESDYHAHREIQQPQDPSDQRGPRYNNDVTDGWLRGSGGDGRKPTFDFDGHSHHRADKGVDWNSGSDRRPEKDTGGERGEPRADKGLWHPERREK